METELLGVKWANSYSTPPVIITYSFAESRIEIALQREFSGYPKIESTLTSIEQTLFDKAVAAWEAAAAIDLQKKTDSTSVDIRVGLAGIDGKGNVLGQATYWSNNGNMDVVSIVFDTADLVDALFTTDTPAKGQVSFYQLALHELGHALGIGHDPDSDDLMYAYANGSVKLSSDNKEAIVSLYGLPLTKSPEPVGPVENGIDKGFYLATYKDVAAAGIDPATHYHNAGWKESRDPNAIFDTSWYLQTYTDVAQAKIDPLEHYRNNGWKEHRNPSQQFSTDSYLEKNRDVALAGINPMDHYLLYGAAEGRLV